ncbi:hypothetical protein BXZ70DRAFT_108700 [Cristinia sonorae]|uniref:Uncharacterized protein n=1 Tax=Cristinia sonorae TaxID=1940300 RepID=A0A8K0UNS3_9AGAR|nr:hypothetical protein BXZ70DRAFT_108700 [Cristinia sonorae]
MSLLTSRAALCSQQQRPKSSQHVVLHTHRLSSTNEHTRLLPRFRPFAMPLSVFPSRHHEPSTGLPTISVHTSNTTIIQQASSHRTNRTCSPNLSLRCLPYATLIPIMNGISEARPSSSKLLPPFWSFSKELPRSPPWPIPPFTTSVPAFKRRRYDDLVSVVCILNVHWPDSLFHMTILFLFLTSTMITMVPGRLFTNARV